MQFNHYYRKQYESFILFHKMFSNHFSSLRSINHIDVNSLNLDVANNLSFLVSLILSVHTALYPFIESGAFTRALLSMICPMFSLNSIIFFILYMQQEKVFKSFSLFYLGNIMSYSIFFIPNNFFLKINYILISFLLVNYLTFLFYRFYMQYMHNFTDTYHNYHWDTAVLPFEKISVSHNSNSFECRTLSKKSCCWWDVNFGSMKYSSWSYNGGKFFCLNLSDFNKYFNQRYSLITVGQIIATHTDNMFRIEQVRLVDNKVEIYYTDLGTNLKKGDCYTNLENYWCFEKVLITVGGPMNSNNHIYGKGQDINANEYNSIVRNYKRAFFFKMSNYGWYKKEKIIIPSKNNCRPLPPLSFEERTNEKNKFIESLNKSNNTIRLSKYLQECINWYHGHKFKKTATLEYRIRWQEHKKWLLGSPIVKEYLHYDLSVEKYNVVEYIQEKSTSEEIKHLDHRPKKNIETIVYPASRRIPPVIYEDGKNKPASGYKMKDYRVKVKCECNCGETEEFKIRPEYSNIVKTNNYLEDFNYAISWSEVKNIKKEKICTSKKKIMEVSKKTFKNSNRFECLEIEVPAIEPYCLSHETIYEEVPKTKKQRNIYLDKKRIEKKKIKKIFKKDMEKIGNKLDFLKKNKYSKIEKDHSGDKPGSKVIQRKFIFSHKDDLNIKEWFDKINKDNNYPKANPIILNDIGELNSIQIRKKYKISRKHVLFLMSNIKNIWSENEMSYEEYFFCQDDFKDFV